jgi:hypothetical protein
MSVTRSKFLLNQHSKIINHQSSISPTTDCLSLYADRRRLKLKNMNQEDINEAIQVVGSEEKLNKMVLQVAKMNKKLPGMEWSFC